MPDASAQASTATLLANLTGPQSEAVTHTDGPLLVLAGAGCGKTRVITRRAAHLAATVTRPRHVLAITFTNKAANEMRERLFQLGVGREMTVCTFHALGARLLRMYAEEAGLSADFTIFDAADQRKVIKNAITEAGLSIDNWRPGNLQRVVSNAKNAMVTASQYADQATDWADRSLARVYEAYEAILAAQHGVDFDDLLMRVALLLQGNPALRARLEERYTHVLIDEYQDTNLAQYEIARLLTGARHNLCATGDPDQSIYGWRGADIRNILRFEEDYADARVVRLEQNYRSTQRILAAASAVIEHNVHRKRKSLWTENPPGGEVRVAGFGDAEAEADFLAEDIDRQVAAGADYSDFAVFYRTNALSRGVEEQFIRAGIPYQVARGTEFYNRKEIKDVLAYTRVLVNPRDEIALTRAINTPARGIGTTTVNRLRAHAVAAGVPLAAILARVDELPDVKGAARKRVAAFVDILHGLTDCIDASPSAGLAQILSCSGLQADLSQQAQHDPEPLENVNELLNAAAVFESSQPEGSLRDWLEYTSLLGDVDAIDSVRGTVTLMTLHAAKGLEFPGVYVIAAEEGLLPFRRDAVDAQTDLEEERRLCFVGMTRAQRCLTLSYAHYRMVRGVSERKLRSVFLDELPTAEIEWLDHTGRGPTADRRAGLPADIDRWEVNTLVRHPAYDLGQVLWLRRNGAQVRVGVRFRDGMEKTFVLPFAVELERVDWDEVGDL